MLLSEQAKEMAPHIIDTATIGAGALRQAGFDDEQIVTLLCGSVFQEVDGVDLKVHLEAMKHLVATAIVQLSKYGDDLLDLHKRLENLVELAKEKGLMPRE